MSKMMSVQVKKCQVRNQPSCLGKIVSDLAYGDQVSILEEKESWFNVKPASNNRPKRCIEVANMACKK